MGRQGAVRGFGRLRPAAWAGRWLGRRRRARLAARLRRQAQEELCRRRRAPVVDFRSIRCTEALYEEVARRLEASELGLDPSAATALERLLVARPDRSARRVDREMTDARLVALLIALDAAKEGETGAHTEAAGRTASPQRGDAPR